MVLARDERGEGPVLLLLHAFPLDRRLWEAQLEGLADRRRVVAVDLRGAGRSRPADPEAPVSMDLLADDVARTLDDLGAERADVAGISMGGYVAFALWRRHRRRVRSLVLADTRAEADTPEGRRAREELVRLLREGGMEAVWEAMGARLLRPDPPRAHLDRLRRILLEQDPAGVAALALALRDRPDVTAELPGITVPVLWLHGAEDQITPVDGARASSARIPSCRFVEVPGAGHLPPLERPEETNQAIAAFLAEVDAREATGA
jgi:3-oxoadipate enol-lactonase